MFSYLRKIASQVRIDELFEFYTQPKYPDCEPCVLWSIFFRHAKPISPLKLFIGCACFFIPSFKLISLFFVRQLIGKKNGNKTHIFSFPSKLQHLIIYHVSISKPKRFYAFDHIARTGTNRWAFWVLYWAKISKLWTVCAMIDFLSKCKTNQPPKIVRRVCMFFHPILPAYNVVFC